MSRHLLARASLLGAMPAVVLDALSDAADIRRFRRGAYLWRVGDPGDNLQIVHEGLVLIGVTGADGDELVLHVVAPGDCMGEPSIYAPHGDRQTNARAVVATTTLFIPGRSVRAALETSPEAMRLFVCRVSEICRAHARRVADTAFHDARGRIARVLLDLLASHGVPVPGGQRIGLELSQRTLAGLMSARRESVNRLIGQLEREGVVRFEAGIVTVLKPQILRVALGADDRGGRDA